MIIDATLSNPASSSVSATDVAAWIGAITGVGLLLWGIYTWWHSGPRLRVEALPNLFPGDLPVAPIPENRSFLQIKVYNHGDRETTLTRLALTFYPTRWSKWRGHTKWEIDPIQILPFKLDAGGQWTSVQIKQTEDLVSRARKGYLFVRVFHGARKEPASARLLIPDPEPLPE